MMMTEQQLGIAVLRNAIAERCDNIAKLNALVADRRAEITKIEADRDKLHVENTAMLGCIERLGGANARAEAEAAAVVRMESAASMFRK